MKKNLILSLILLYSVLTIDAQQIFNENIIAGGNNGLYWKGFKSTGGSGLWGFQQNEIMFIGIGSNLYNRGFSLNAMGIMNGLTTKEDIYLLNKNGSDADFLVLKASGKVGIGVSSPNAALHVESSGSFLRLSNNTNNYAYSGIDGSGFYLEQVADSPEKSKIRFQTRNSNQGNYTQFYIDGATSKFTFVNGNVEIGSPNPDPSYKLNVEGRIRASEIVLSMQSGSDFVFESEYKLMNLNTLEEFVKSHHHLPEIASEKEMIVNGLNMKEFQMKLLQKIEELTLYTIEQNKKIEEQNLELIILKEKIVKIEAASR